jgi:hypothetical protein
MVFCIAFCSCTRQTLLPKEERGKQELSTFLLSQVAKYGGSNAPSPSGVVTGITNYVYSEDKDGFQVVCNGNNVGTLRNILESQFGEPALVKTNARGVASFVYAIHQIGVAITCGLDTNTVSGARQELTHMTVVKAGVLK